MAVKQKRGIEHKTQGSLREWLFLLEHGSSSFSFLVGEGDDQSSPFHPRPRPPRPIASSPMLS